MSCTHPQLHKERDPKTFHTYYRCTNCPYWEFRDQSGALITKYKDRSQEEGKVIRIDYKAGEL